MVRPILIRGDGKLCNFTTFVALCARGPAIAMKRADVLGSLWDDADH
jgi:hypothetical protein